ncbi:MAG: LysM domain-containing protein, partial [Patescibacteria group bacterium]
TPFWNEVTQRNAEKKQHDVKGRYQHTRDINKRAHELYDDWKMLSPEERDALKRKNDKVRAHQKFVLLRAQETCHAKQYGSLTEAERDAQMLDTLGDNILVKDRFAQLVETSSERAATVTAEFDEDEPTILKPRVKSPVPPKPGFFRRMTAPFVAAASLLVGLGGAQQTAERTTDMLSQPDTKEQAYEPAPLPVVERSETKASDGQATVRANEERPSESVSGKQATHVVEKGDRLWDVARQEIADERGVDLKRVARDDREILPRVQALKILNDIDDATKLEVGTELRLEETKAPVAKEVPQAQAYGNGVAVPTHLEAASIDKTPDIAGKLDATPTSTINAPREVITSRGDTAWAHADSMLENAGAKSTTLRRRLVAALMLKDSGNLNAYRLKIGQELTTTRANAAIEQLKAGKNPADIARSMGIEWPVRGL